MENTVVFFRVFYPKPGLVKPKIAQEAGYNVASAVYHELIRYTYHHIEKLSEKSNIVIFYEPHRYKAEIKALFGEMEFDFEPMPTKKTELETIAACYEHCFKKGYKKVIHSLIDDPILTFDLIDKASVLLDSYKSVIGPTTNKNIYLLGLNLENYNLVLNEMMDLASFNLDNARKLAAVCELKLKELEPQIIIETMSDWEEFAKTIK